MIAIAIDDEPIALDVVQTLSKKVPFLTLEATFTNAFEAITYLQQHKVDLIFLDIKMPDISGIDFMKILSKPPMVIFTTAYSEHAVQSFELDAIDYLLKPFSLARFLKACNKAKELLNLRSQGSENKVDFIFFKDGYEQVKVLLSEIMYIEASGNYTQIHLAGDKLLSSRITINEMVDLLPSWQFVRTHRAFIISKDKISKYDRVQVWIGNQVIPIGSTYSDCLKEL
ncbi:LytR/AlgR family response regulator transcription factor [Pedobacter duraquae]|uniref:LytTR family two component transcriptional regulator n=1 Tax=Pedobacter duraquae TaxID=425511 RepID=A0A4R6INK6_9SPHI|nr:LytTR family DNA-binding domain-containing protein [Pedobacter duraquae]TDO23844.1 LytTR family two component transcriptional regulator [Pedobacter duraquae]